MDLNMKQLIFSLTLFISAFTLADSSAISQRIAGEMESRSNYFVITPHKPNYLLPVSYSKHTVDYQNANTVVGSANDFEQQNIEVKFQFSVKTPIWDKIYDSPFSLYFAYTQVSFWQAYNGDFSSPFRETNYEPEIFLSWLGDIPIGDDWHLNVVDFSLVHQSNGRGGNISRSWNRLSSNLIFANQNKAFIFHPWYRIPEDDQVAGEPLDPSLDNNPDITDYMGHGEMLFIYKYDNSTFSFKSRNNLESNFSRGAVEASWSFPIHNKMKGYVQIFSGYGQNMIEYNMHNTAIGIGFSLTDWL
jgi:phospholipase A1